MPRLPEAQARVRGGREAGGARGGALLGERAQVRRLVRPEQLHAMRLRGMRRMRQ
jgi:hypothetical protein